jgi:formylglycine-generating enzyme required for sulfatase activity
MGCRKAFGRRVDEGVKHRVLGRHSAATGWGGPYGGGTNGENRGRTVPADSFAPNPWGLYQVHGNVYEWAEDCWNDNYNGAPADGSAWISGDCSYRTIRGGSWDYDPRYLRSASRLGYAIDTRDVWLGFRVGRTLLTP